MAHSWIIRFLEHRIADKRILRLIAKWLKVGTVEDGRRTRGVCGAPQGTVISPILANVYLHYVFDLWVHRWRLTKASGDIAGGEEKSSSLPRPFNRDACRRKLDPDHYGPRSKVLSEKPIHPACAEVWRRSAV